MATKKKSKAKVVKAIRVKKTKNVKTVLSFNDKVNALGTFRNLYANLNRNFVVGNFVVLNNYSFLSDHDNTYRMAVVLEAPKLFAKYKEYKLAYVTEDNIVRTASVEKNDIICRLEDAPSSFALV